MIGPHAVHEDTTHAAIADAVSRGYRVVFERPPGPFHVHGPDDFDVRLEAERHGRRLMCRYLCAPHHDLGHVVTLAADAMDRAPDVPEDAPAGRLCDCGAGDLPAFDHHRWCAAVTFRP